MDHVDKYEMRGSHEMDQGDPLSGTCDLTRELAFYSNVIETHGVS